MTLGETVSKVLHYGKRRPETDGNFRDVIVNPAIPDLVLPEERFVELAKEGALPTAPFLTRDQVAALAKAKKLPESYYMVRRPKNEIGASLMGFIGGVIAGGPVVGVAGGLAGYLGTLSGNRTGSFIKALGVGIGTGGVATMVGLAAMAAIAGAPIVPALLAWGGIVGGLAGVAGTISGSRAATHRDSVYGGLLATGLLFALGMPPLSSAMLLAAPAGAGLGSVGNGPVRRAVLAALAGAVTGSAAAAVTAPDRIALGAIQGALAGAIGTLIGPAIQQLRRNFFTDTLTWFDRKSGPILDTRVKPFLDRHPPLKWATVLSLTAGAGALLGGILAPIVSPSLVALGAIGGGLVGIVQGIRLLAAGRNKKPLPVEPAPPGEPPAGREPQKVAAPTNTETPAAINTAAP